MSTLHRMLEFDRETKRMMEDYPDIPFKVARDYILTGEKRADVPDEYYALTEHLQSIRKAAIASEMIGVAAKARLKGKQMEPDVLSGDALDPVFQPEAYAFAHFLYVFGQFSWYTHEEMLDYCLSDRLRMPYHD